MARRLPTVAIEVKQMRREERGACPRSGSGRKTLRSSGRVLPPNYPFTCTTNLSLPQYPCNARSLSLL